MLSLYLQCRPEMSMTANAEAKQIYDPFLIRTVALDISMIEATYDEDVTAGCMECRRNSSS